jgi:hypothetical protein
MLERSGLSDAHSVSSSFCGILRVHVSLYFDLFLPKDNIHSKIAKAQSELNGAFREGVTSSCSSLSLLMQVLPHG